MPGFVRTRCMSFRSASAWPTFARPPPLIFNGGVAIPSSRCVALESTGLAHRWWGSAKWSATGKDAQGQANHIWRFGKSRFWKTAGRKKGRPVTLDHAKIRQMRADGMGATAIARAMGCTASGVYKVLASDNARQTGQSRWYRVVLLRLVSVLVTRKLPDRT